MSFSLLAQTQGLIERTYGTATGIADIGPFIIGDRGYRRLAERHEIVRRVDAPHMPVQAGETIPGPQVLVRVVDGGTALAVYLPDDLIARLERRPPTLRLDEANVDDFADFVEEVDHFVHLAHGLAHAREMSLLEMEIRANISKALVLSHFVGRLSGQKQLGAAQRRWVRFHLFEKKGFAEQDAAVQERYEEARRYAVQFLAHLASVPADARLRTLRRWNALPAPRKIRQRPGGLL